MAYFLMTFLVLVGWIFGALRSFDIKVICSGWHPEGLGTANGQFAKARALQLSPLYLDPHLVRLRLVMAVQKWTVALMRVLSFLGSPPLLSSFFLHFLVCVRLAY